MIVFLNHVNTCKTTFHFTDGYRIGMEIVGIVSRFELAGFAFVRKTELPTAPVCKSRPPVRACVFVRAAPTAIKSEGEE